MKTSEYFSNEAIVEQFGELLSTGKVVVVAHNPSSDKSQIRLDLAQQLPDRRLTFGQLFGSKSNTQVLRAWHSVDKAHKKSLAPGTVLDDFRLFIVDKLNPQYEGHQPRTTREGAPLVDSDGNPIYRVTHIGTQDEASRMEFIIPAVVGEWEEA